tara:strand:+ start:251 stop:472 length:222 start_codon:yes stop_codon:yes gene_type:complete
MLDDGSAELFSGFWPFMKRFLLLFLPLWVFLITWAAGLNIIIASILAGLSVSTVPIYEKYRLKQESQIETGRQ